MLSSTGNTFRDARCSMDGATSVHLASPSGRCLMCIDNSLILHIYIIVRKHYYTYFELIHAFYIWFWNNAE